MRFSATMKNNTATKPTVGIIMGSQSDWSTMGEAAALLKQLDIPLETKIVSAHRTPKLLYSYAEEAEERGIQVIIAGAGGAAHLPGMTAAVTHLPVLGRARAVQVTQWPRLAPLDRANACGHPRDDTSDWRSWC
jgi:phosphoribosylcarboxyaminoimidazole (NCAIR) mutase